MKKCRLANLSSSFDSRSVIYSVKFPYSRTAASFPFLSHFYKLKELQASLKRWNKMLRKDKSCHHFLRILSLTWVLVLRSSNLESEVPRIKPANKLTKPIFSFTLKASQTLIDSQHLLFHLHRFCCLPSLTRCSSVTNIVFFFFHHWEPFLVSFYTAERAHPHKHANNWNTVWWGYWGDEKSFSVGEEECFWNQGSWSEKSSMNIAQK